MLTGANLIAGTAASDGVPTISAVNPASGAALEPRFHEATDQEVTAAVDAAYAAFRAGLGSGHDRARLLRAIAEEIEALGHELVSRVMQETGLPEGRVRGERGRTTGQLRLFADVAEEGSWVDARIDTALPERQPIPKPDIRSLLTAIGPVGVFGASNFPLAFSVAGGDTASALAAGCPVVCKAHPAHPGTSELVGRAINRAVENEGFHPGTFSLIHGAGAAVGTALVGQEGIRAVGFTGSLAAGRALANIGASRRHPIPVFAEMGSVNPVFVLPGALAERGSAIGKGLAGSVTLGAGQFCTNPGLVFLQDGPGSDAFVRSLSDAIADTSTQTMLHAGIRSGFHEGLDAAQNVDGVSLLASGGDGGDGAASARACVLSTEFDTFRNNPALHQEIFGPSTIVVRCASAEEMAAAADLLEGDLTGTLHGTEDDLSDAADLIASLTDRVGRIILNGFPTGVEVCPSMHHGGPYPATTDARWTSVGTRAILRWARPVCYQSFPEQNLPAELQDANPRGIWRLVNGERTNASI